MGSVTNPQSWTHSCDACGVTHDRTFSSAPPEGWARLTINFQGQVLEDASLAYILCHSCAEATVKSLADYFKMVRAN